MIAPQFDSVAELKSAFTVLTKNLSLAAIPTIAFVVVGCIFAVALGVSGFSIFAVSGMNDAGALMSVLGGALFACGIAAVLSVILLVIAQAAVIAGSEAVWEGRSPDLAAGVGKAFGKVVDLLLVGLVLAVIVVAVSWTVVGPLILGFLMMYVVPAIVVGGEGAFAAIATSWRLSTKNAGPTFAAFAGIVLIGIAGGIVNAILGHVWIVGWIAALLVLGFVTAYQALVIVRFYDLLGKTALPPAM